MAILQITNYKFPYEFDVFSNMLVCLFKLVYFEIRILLFIEHIIVEFVCLRNYWNHFHSTVVSESHVFFSINIECTNLYCSNNLRTCAFYHFYFHNHLPLPFTLYKYQLTTSKFAILSFIQQIIVEFVCFSNYCNGLHSTVAYDVSKILSIYTEHKQASNITQEAQN